MNEIIISIKKIYVDKIFSGKKKYEFRKIKPKEKIDKLYIYETNPTKKVVGEVVVSSILIDSPINIWNLTKENSGMTKKSFLEYFKNKKIAYAFVLSDVIRYENPKTLADFHISAAPQSFIYIK